MLNWVLPPVALFLWVIGFGCYFYHRRIGEFWKRLRAPKDGEEG